jgi:hypothetical protein
MLSRLVSATHVARFTGVNPLFRPVFSSVFGFLELMTSSNTLKKLVSIGAAMLLAVGGSLVAAEPAHAQIATSAPTIAGSPFVSSVLTATAGRWATGTATGKWYLCAGGVSDLSASAIPTGCSPMETSSSDATPITTSNLTVSPIVYCGSTCTQMGTNPVGSKLRWIETNGSDISASAAVLIRNGIDLSLVAPAAGDTSAVLNVSGTCTFANPTLGAFTDWTLAVAGSSRAITSVATASNKVTLNFATALTAGQSISVNYAFASDPLIVCSALYAISSFSAPKTGTVPGGNLYTVTFNPNGGTLTSGSLTVTQSSSGNVVSVPRLSKADCTQGPWSNSLAANTAIFTPVSSLTISASWVCANSVTDAVTTVTEAAKPLPVWAAPILKQIPTLSKTLNTDGGKVSLTDGDFSTLKTVTVGGKEVAFSTDAKGNVNIPIPAGAAGTTADLVVTFTGGKMVIQDGIKYVAPTDVAKVAEAGVAGFKANSSKVSGALAASILYAAQIDHKANAIACSGYAASKAQVALATARAQAACDYATGAYSNLTKSTVAVIVNKAKAKSASVGIKVYH